MCYLRCYLISLGFDITQINYLISKTNIRDDDHLVFVVPSKEIKGRSEQTRAAIEVTLEGIKARGVGIEYSYFKVSETDVTSDLKALLQYTMKKDFSEIIIWAVGGTRSIVSLLILYGQVDPRVERIYVYSESEYKILEVPILTNIIYKISATDLRILMLLKEKGELNIKKLISAFNGSVTSVYKSIRKLHNKGLIYKRSGRGGKVGITPLGEILLMISKMGKL